MSTPRAGPRLRWWLLGANLFVLLAPLVAVVGLRLYDTLLVRQTERQLIAQSVLIGEAWREDEPRRARAVPRRAPRGGRRAGGALLGHGPPAAL